MWNNSQISQFKELLKDASQTYYFVVSQDNRRCIGFKWPMTQVADGF